MARTGRPTKLTPARQKQICALLKTGVPEEAAAIRSGIDRATFFRWVATGEKTKAGLYHDFSAEVKRAIAESEAALVKLIRKAATDFKTWQAAAWLLERRFPARYTRLERRELSGPDGRPVQVQAQPMDRAALAAEIVANLRRAGVPVALLEGAPGSIPGGREGGDAAAAGGELAASVEPEKEGDDE